MAVETALERQISQTHIVVDGVMLQIQVSLHRALTKVPEVGLAFLEPREDLGGSDHIGHVANSQIELVEDQFIADILAHFIKKSMFKGFMI